MPSANEETVEVADDDGIAKTSDEVFTAGDESVKASEEGVTAQISEETSGADTTETVEAGE